MLRSAVENEGYEVGTVSSAVGVVKAGGAVCTMVVSGTKGVVIVGTRWGAGTA